MSLLVHISVGKGLRQAIKTTVQGNLTQYFSYFNQQIGNPPNLKIATKLSQQLKTKIVITNEHLNWSSDGLFPTEQAKDNLSELYITIKNPPYTTLFIIKKHLPSVEKLLLNTLLSMLIVLILIYILLRYITHPLKIIQKGIRYIASGDMDYRIKLKQQDEFGELAKTINQMADDIQQMLEAKRQLLLAISHELRSPLTRMKVALSLMEESKLKHRLDKDINEMAQLITDLLEVERLNHRHQALNLSSVNINQLIQTVVKEQETEQTIILELDPKITNQSLDQTRWKFVIKNLLSNALKYNQTTKPITIKTLQFKTTWTVSVIDQGVGIPKQYIPYLTEPFYRLDSSRQRKTGGYGLGLHIVKMIIESHHGLLKINSEEGKGTCVEIEMNCYLEK